MRSLRKNTESYIEEAKIKHKNFYTYEKTVYTGCKNTIIVTCPKHGDFTLKAYSHLSKNGCSVCAREKTNMSTTEEFIVKANKVHNKFYSYSNSDYKGAKEFLTITCPVHGDFNQRPNYHLSGNGCTLCYKENNGFGKTKFLNSCKKTGKGTIYLIRCFSDTESFYKIGITSKTIQERFKKKDKLPYDYEIIKRKVDYSENIFNLEKVLHRKYRDFKYTPLKPFRGSTECFLLTKKIIDNDF